jgi:hypothetical protein
MKGVGTTNIRKNQMLANNDMYSLYVIHKWSP